MSKFMSYGMNLIFISSILLPFSNPSHGPVNQKLEKGTAHMIGLAT